MPFSSFFHFLRYLSITSMSAPKSQIIVPGKPKEELGNDYYCHLHLGGCGCVFRTNEEFSVQKYWEGDEISSTLDCPSCKKKIKIRTAFNFNPKGITYCPMK